MKDAGPATDRREGRWAYYKLNPDAFAQLESFVGGLPSRRLAVLVAARRLTGTLEKTRVLGVNLLQHFFMRA